MTRRDTLDRKPIDKRTTEFVNRLGGAFDFERYNYYDLLYHGRRARAHEPVRENNIYVRPRCTVDVHLLRRRRQYRVKCVDRR